MSKLPDSTFAERFAYARWVRVVDEDDKALARRIGLSAGWVAKWKVRVTAPPGRREGPALARALGVTDDWLLDNKGDPPRPELWDEWLAIRRSAPPVEAVADREQGARAFVAKRAKKKAAKKAAKKTGS